MTEHTFRSPDTATAMDRVQRELGDDAYIPVSYTHLRAHET